VEDLGLNQPGLSKLVPNNPSSNNGLSNTTGQPMASNNPLLTLMGFEATTLENLVRLSRLTVSEVSSMLMLLELEGKVTSLTGGQYQKIV